jgi:peptidoglycan-associated lipoprotein
MVRKSLFAFSLFATALLGACASDSQKDAASASAGRSGGPAPGSTAVGAAAPVAPAPADRRINFAFDSSDLDAADRKVLDAWATYLSANPSVRVTLEGHCDERGTREYNVGLGERRANAAQRHLLAKGVGRNQLTVTSFGEERPLVQGHDEKAWAQNRRVEIVLQ